MHVVGYPRQISKISLPIENWVLTDIGFYVSFKGEAHISGDYVGIDNIMLYNSCCKSSCQNTVHLNDP